MFVNIDEEEIEFCDLPTGAVFEYDGITYMRVEEVTEEEGEEYFTPAALNLATLLVEHYNWDLEIPARCVFKPTEITFK